MLYVCCNDFPSVNTSVTFNSSLRKSKDKFNLHVVPFDIDFHDIDNAFMCTA